MGTTITTFSEDYFTARSRFRDAIQRAGGNLETLPIDARGPNREDLGVDIAWFGSREPKRVLIHSSGLHGVEGFAGSAIQLSLLDALPPIPDDSALILVHVLNPYGMAWLRRVNEKNVDLNRNCLEGESHSGAPPAYGQIDEFLNPRTPPSPDWFRMRALWLGLRYGQSALKQAVAGGQYEFERGLFFGGRRLQQSLDLYRTFLDTRLKSAERVVAVDIHTGVGKYAQDLLLVDAENFDTMRRLLGERVTALEPDRSAAYRVRGGIQTMIFKVLAHANVSFVGQEFGTFSGIDVVQALREENRWHHYGRATLDHPTKRRIKITFCPEDPAWRRAVIERGRALFDETWKIATA